LKLSIITINKDNASGLEKTIQSVISQTYSDFEYIIIDGNSTDGSVEILKKYDAKINYWVIEPDTGIYNAMNKGIRKAQGEFCLFLNSGDWLISSTILDNVFTEISTCIPSDIYYSDRTQTDGTVFNFPESLTINYLISTPLSHQNSFIKRSLFFEHGFFNEDLSFVSDWEFFLKELWKYESKFTHIRTIFSIFDMNRICVPFQDNVLAITYHERQNRTANGMRHSEIMTMHQNVFENLAETTIEINNYRNTVYRNIIENYGTVKLLVFLLKLYRLIISRTIKLRKFISKLRDLKLYILKIINSFGIFFSYLHEFFISIFNKSIRICFSNFRDVPHNYFLIPLHTILNSHNLTYRMVKFYNPQIHFFSVYGRKKKIIKSNSLCKIFYTGENTNLEIEHQNYKGNCIENVSLSLGFDYYNADNYSRLPLWLLYYFLPNYSRDDIRIKLDNFKKKYSKIKFCSLIASHDKSGIRTRIYNEVSKINYIDCAGALLHNNDTLHKRYANDKAVYLQQYKFNICPENSISPGYVTEKLFQSLYSGCIPIYSGWSRDPEPDIVNPNIIIWYDSNDDTNNTSFLNEVKKLHSDDNLYRSFIAQPFFCDTAVDKIYSMLQQFTNKMQYYINKSLIEKSQRKI
jgi:glycosyltransferase involved in cell wall biosynthesis